MVSKPQFGRARRIRLHDLRCAHHFFFRHTANIYAGAAPALWPFTAHFGLAAARLMEAINSTAAADGDVIIVFSHGDIVIH